MATPASGAGTRLPTYGHSDDTEIGVMLNTTYGVVNEDDPEDLAKIPVMVKAFRKELKAIDCGDLRAATKPRFEAALATAVPRSEVPGTLRMLLKYLGAPSKPHVPPGVSALLPCERLLSRHLQCPRRPIAVPRSGCGGYGRRRAARGC